MYKCVEGLKTQDGRMKDRRTLDLQAESLDGK
jgi:hypothetical protein